MKIRCAKNYAQEIAKILDTIQGRSSVATISVSDVLDMTDELLALKRKYGKKVTGCSREYCEGGASASAYKYSRPATYIRVVLEDVGCYLTDITREAYYPKSGRINRINLTPAVKVEQGYRLGRKVANNIATMKKGKNKAVSDSMSGECVFFALGLVRALIDKNVIEPALAATTLKRRVKVLANGKWTEKSFKDELFDFANDRVRIVVDLLPITIEESIDYSFLLYGKRNSVDDTPQVELRTGVIDESVLNLNQLMLV
jgi:hypothetical protein